MSDHLSNDFKTKLKNAETRSNALNEIKALPENVAVDTISKLGLNTLLQCLNDPSQVDATCEVLERYFSMLTLGDIVQHHVSNIMFLLRHEKESVRELAVKELYKIIMTDASQLPLPEYLDVYIVLAQCIGDSNIGIASSAKEIVCHLDVGAYPKIVEELEVSLSGNTSSRCNGFEAVVIIASKSPDLFELCTSFGYIQQMIDDLSSKDLLYQMNILELLSKLAISPHGLNYLIENNVLNQMANFIIGLKENPLGNILVPGYMKFFGTIAHVCPQKIFNDYPVIVNALFDALESSDVDLLPVALDTLGFIGSTVEGKYCLAAVGHRFTSAVRLVGSYIKNSTTEIKIRALECAEGLIGYRNNEQIDNRITLMSREWFRGLSDHPASIDVLFNACKIPFPSLKMSAFGLLRAVCQHQWGEEFVAHTPGFIEFLLDRKLDTTKEVTELKYEIIKSLSKSTAFDSTNIIKMTSYVEQGPFFTEAELNVATEEMD